MYRQYSPSRIILGENAVDSLPDIVKPFGKRGIIVADPVISKSRFVQDISENLKKENTQTIVFDELSGRLNTFTIDTLVALCLASRAEFVIGVGGIQALTIAKTAAGFCGSEGIFSDKMYNLSENSKKLAYIEIPGAMRNPQLLSSSAWIADKNTRIPQLISVPDNYPAAVVLDPEIIDSLSDTFFYSALMDMFLLSVEGYVSPMSNFFCDSLFLKTTAIVLSLQQKDQSQYRSSSSGITAMEAGLLYSYGRTTILPGIGESLSRAINTRFQVPKAIVSSILLPHVLEFLSERKADRIARMASILEIPIDNLPDREAAQRVVENVRFHIGLEGVPTRLSEFSVSIKEFKNLASIVSAMPHLKKQDINEESIHQLIEKTF